MRPGFYMRWLCGRCQTQLQSKRKLLLLLLIVVVVDIGPVSVRAVVPGADGGVFVVVVLAALVVGSSVVHPVGQVGLQSLLVEAHVHELLDPLLHVGSAAIPDIPLGSAQLRQELLSFGRRDAHGGPGWGSSSSCHVSPLEDLVQAACAGHICESQQCQQETQPQ